MESWFGGAEFSQLLLVLKLLISPSYLNEILAGCSNLGCRFFSFITLSMSCHSFPEKAMAPPLQYSCLENPMDGGAWWATVHGVAKSQTRLSDFTFTVHFHALEKEMATHSSTLAWRIPGTGEPGGLPSMGSHRVRHD